MGLSKRNRKLLSEGPLVFWNEEVLHSKGMKKNNPSIVSEDV